MAAGYYELYQLKPVSENRELRYRPLRYLREHAHSVTIDNYESMLWGDLQSGENVKMLRERLEKDLSQQSQTGEDPSRNDGARDATSLCINIGDVIAVTTDGLTAAYYVDPTNLILLPDFFHQPASGALITIDSDNFPLDGRKGSWMTIDTLRIDGRNLFLMQSETYGRDAPYVVIDEHGRELAADKNGFTADTIERIRQSLKEMETEQALQVSQSRDKKPRLEVWQQYFENGEYLRAAEITEEQNYNMIDGTMNNRTSKRSILERLQEKQGQVSSISTPARFQDSQSIEDAERIRK